MGGNKATNGPQRLRVVAVVRTPVSGGQHDRDLELQHQVPAENHHQDLMDKTKNP